MSERRGRLVMPEVLQASQDTLKAGGDEQLLLGKTLCSAQQLTERQRDYSASG